VWSLFCDNVISLPFISLTPSAPVQAQVQPSQPPAPVQAHEQPSQLPAPVQAQAQPSQLPAPVHAQAQPSQPPVQTATAGVPAPAAIEFDSPSPSTLFWQTEASGFHLGGLGQRVDVILSSSLEDWALDPYNLFGLENLTTELYTEDPVAGPSYTGLSPEVPEPEAGPSTSRGQDSTSNNDDEYEM
ncbi:hypothetical protein HWV62_9131, partial [Athelia sp. TMB]